LGKTIGDLRRRARQADSELSAARQTAEQVHGQIQAGMFGRKESSLAESLEHGGKVVSGLRRRIQIDERLEQNDRRRRQLQEQVDASLDRQLMPAWQMIGVGALFVLGLTMAVA